MKTMSEKPEQMPDNATERPLVTFAVLAYNQEQYIREAVEGAFAQTYEPLEIILSDDCSTDLTYEIMREMAAKYVGPHVISTRRGECNLGISEHFNQIVKVAAGDMLVVAAGDDISLAHRVELSVEVLRSSKDLGFVDFGEVLFSGETGLRDTEGSIYALAVGKAEHEQAKQFDIESLLEGVAPAPRGASRILNLKKLRLFGPLRQDCPSEDSTTRLRLLMSCFGINDPRPVIYRRVTESSLSSNTSMRVFPFDRLFEQYKEDIEEGIRKGLMNSEIAARLNGWAKDKVRARQNAQILYLAKSGDRSKTKQVLRSPEFSYRKKITVVLSRLRMWMFG